MRVGFDLSVCAFNQAGVARYAEALLPALRGLEEREGITIIPLALPPAFRAVAPGLKRKTVSLLWELFYGPFWLPALAHRHRLDVLHLAMPLPIGPLPCPMVTMIHDAIPFLFPEWFAPVMGARLRRWIRAGAHRSTHLLTNSHTTARDVERLALAPGTPITTTYLASALEAGRPTASPSDRPYILTVGTLEPRKNLATVLDAYQRLITHVPHPPDLVVVGATGWLADEVVARARQLALGERVRLLGYVSDAHLAHLYAQAAMLVFPALYEGFGIPPLEAMGFGCPVIVSNVSSLPEVVGAAGLLVKPTDAPSLTAAMHLLLSQPALAAELRTRGKTQAARFSWARCAQETLSVYRQVVAPACPQPALAHDG